MTKDEVNKIAKIMLTADGWCVCCGPSLLEKLARCFPEHAGLIEAIEARRDELELAFDDARAAWEYGSGTPEPEVWEITLPPLKQKEPAE